jgi:hypothetical protein
MFYSKRPYTRFWLALILLVSWLTPLGTGRAQTPAQPDRPMTIQTYRLMKTGPRTLRLAYLYRQQRG